METTAQPTVSEAMDNITIRISRDHYDLILKAIDHYNESIKERLANQAQISLMKGSHQKEWTVTAVDNVVTKVSNPHAKSTDAPYGYKKDGTPKQRPGRKAA